MLKIDDTVKVKMGTMHQGERKEFFPIGTICRVIDTEYSEEEGNTVELVPERELSCKKEVSYDAMTGYWYLESEVEKGHLEWVKDE